MGPSRGVFATKREEEEGEVSAQEVDIFLSEEAVEGLLAQGLPHGELKDRLVQSYEGLIPMCMTVASWLAVVKKHLAEGTNSPSSLPLNASSHAGEVDAQLLNAFRILMERRFDADRLRSYMEEQAPEGSGGWQPPPFYWELMRTPQIAQSLTALCRKDHRSEFLSAFNQDLLTMESRKQRDWKLIKDSELSQSTSNFTIFAQALAEIIQEFLLEDEERELGREDSSRFSRLLCHTENSYFYSQAMLHFIPKWRPDLGGCRRLSQIIYRYVRNVKGDAALAATQSLFSTIGSYPDLYAAFVAVRELADDPDHPLNQSEVVALSEQVTKVLSAFHRHQTMLYTRKGASRIEEKYRDIIEYEDRAHPTAFRPGPAREQAPSQPPSLSHPLTRKADPSISRDLVASQPPPPPGSLPPMCDVLSESPTSPPLLSTVEEPLSPPLSVGYFGDSPLVTTPTIADEPSGGRNASSPRFMDLNEVSASQLSAGDTPHMPLEQQLERARVGATTTESGDEDSNGDGAEYEASPVTPTQGAPGDADAMTFIPASQIGEGVPWTGEYERLREAPELPPMDVLRDGVIIDALLRDFVSSAVNLTETSLARYVELLLDLTTLSPYEILVREVEFGEAPATAGVHNPLASHFSQGKSHASATAYPVASSSAALLGRLPRVPASRGLPGHWTMQASCEELDEGELEESFEDVEAADDEEDFELGSLDRAFEDAAGQPFLHHSESYNQEGASTESPPRGKAYRGKRLIRRRETPSLTTEEELLRGVGPSSVTTSVAKASYNVAPAPPPQHSGFGKGVVSYARGSGARTPATSHDLMEQTDEEATDDDERYASSSRSSSPSEGGDPFAALPGETAPLKGNSHDETLPPDLPFHPAFWQPHGQSGAWAPYHGLSNGATLLSCDEQMGNTRQAPTAGGEADAYPISYDPSTFHPSPYPCEKASADERFSYFVPQLMSSAYPSHLLHDTNQFPPQASLETGNWMPNPHGDIGLPGIPMSYVQQQAQRQQQEVPSPWASFEYPIRLPARSESEGSGGLNGLMQDAGAVRVDEADDDDFAASETTTIAEQVAEMRSTIGSTVFHDLHMPGGTIGLAEDPERRAILATIRKTFRAVARDIDVYKAHARSELFEMYRLVRDPSITNHAARFSSMLPLCTTSIAASAALMYLEFHVLGVEGGGDPLASLDVAVLTVVMAICQRHRNKCSAVLPLLHRCLTKSHEFFGSADLRSTQQSKQLIFAFLMWLLGAGFYAGVLAFIQTHMCHVDRALLRRHLELIFEFCKPPYSPDFVIALLCLVRELIFVRNVFDFDSSKNQKLRALIQNSLAHLTSAWSPARTPDEVVSVVNALHGFFSH